MKYPPSVSESVNGELADVLDAFTDRLNCGEQPDVEEYVQRCPDGGSALRQTLNLLLAFRERPADAELYDNEEDELIAAGQRVLGDFRIIREIGRGGMGIVYEAEQVVAGPARGAEDAAIRRRSR